MSMCGLHAPGMELHITIEVAVKTYTLQQRIGASKIGKGESPNSYTRAGGKQGVGAQRRSYRTAAGPEVFSGTACSAMSLKGRGGQKTRYKAVLTDQRADRMTLRTKVQLWKNGLATKCNRASHQSYDAAEIMVRLWVTSPGPSNLLCSGPTASALAAHRLSPCVFVGKQGRGLDAR